MKKLIALWTNKEVRKKILFTALLLMVFRFLTAIPIPAIPEDAIKTLFSGNAALQAISVVTGGVLASASILSIGLGPYISASYIFQLLSAVVPQIKELYEGGVTERRRLSTYTRLSSIPLALIQSYVIYNFLSSQNYIESLDRMTVISTIMMLTFGATVAMWLGELISESGVSNGTSIIITAGILVTIPANLKVSFRELVDIQEIIIVVVILLAMLIISVLLFIAERRVQIQHSRRAHINTDKASSYIPIKLNPAGVMPVIFAVSLVSFPGIIVPFLRNQTQWSTISAWATKVEPFVSTQIFYNMFLLVTVLFFTVFSALLIFKPKDVAKNLSKQAAFIPGVRPGDETIRFLRKALYQVLVLGAAFLAVLTVVPSLLTSALNLPRILLGGTSILIVAAVILDLVRQISAWLSVDTGKKRYY